MKKRQEAGLEKERTLVLVYHPETGEYVFRQSQLHILEGPDAGKIFDVTEEQTTLGTDAGCNVRIEDRFVSRRHARISQDANGTFIEDLGSSNGTFVDSRRVKRASLASGAIVALGTTRIRFETQGAAIPAPHGKDRRREDPAAVIGRYTVETVHEVKNLIHGIRANAEHLAQRDGSNLPAVNILRGTDHISRCVNKVLTYARTARIERSPCDVAEVLTNTLMFWAPALDERSIKLDREYAAGLQLLCDGRQIQEIFSNLIENALLSMGQGGLLRLSASPEESWLAIRVSDTGPGIPEDVQERIFEPFFTTRPTGRGTGLGLAICRRIAEAHNGFVKLEQTSPAGTTFLVSLPLETA